MIRRSGLRGEPHTSSHGWGGFHYRPRSLIVRTPEKSGKRPLCWNYTPKKETKKHVGEGHGNHIRCLFQHFQQQNLNQGVGGRLSHDSEHPAASSVGLDMSI